MHPLRLTPRIATSPAPHSLRVRAGVQEGQQAPSLATSPSARGASPSAFSMRGLAPASLPGLYHLPPAACKSGCRRAGIASPFRLPTLRPFHLHTKLRAQERALPSP